MGQGAVIKDPTPEWLKPENASVLDSTTTNALRWIASVIGADSPSAQVLGLMTTLVPGAGAPGGLVGKVAEVIEKVKGIRAYHGSPHDFEKFSSANIGTGEGAQAYGHGLYFAEKEGTARAYREALSSVTTAPSYPDLLTAMEASSEAAITAMRSPSPAAEAAARAAQQRVTDLQRAVVVEPKGRMYEVNINADPSHFLDWDAPLSQQPRAVQDAMEQLPIAMRDRWKESGAWPEHVRGKQLYEQLAADKWPSGAPRFSGQHRSPDASATLKAHGVPGIKYLDQGSRTAGEGTRNFVVFDDTIIDILRKYGIALPAALAGHYGQAQGPEGPR